MTDVLRHRKHVSLKIEEINNGKVFVLREHRDYRRTVSNPQYYTGKRPTHNICEAKYFTEKDAKGVRKFAHTGFRYDVYGVPSKQLFLMILQGK